MAGVAGVGLPAAPREARAQNLPGGLSVVQGNAAVKVQGSQMTVTNSAGAVLNWQSFSIGTDHGVRFQQPDTTSRVLNRVVGNDPSNILGSLSSNGQVWLVNPHGVLFGPNARVDVGSLVASTLAIGNDDWRAGRFVLQGASADPTAAVVNQGELRSTAGGRVLLVGGAGGVRNEGVIVAPDGQVALAAGHSVELVDAGLRNVAVRVQAPQGEALNLGSIAVGGGRVDLAAAMVNQQGLVQANALEGHGGQIVLRGDEGVQLGTASRTSADGRDGGTVTIDGGAGRTLLAGELRATGQAGVGGSVQLLGREVGLFDGGVVDASGGAGGGTVRVGGGLQGRDPDVPNAQAVYLDRGATLRADALQRGDGGTIVLWSDHATRAYGRLSARGGPAGGDGGFIETSGGALDARPVEVRTDAPAGRAGRWLLDPNDILISDAVPDLNVTGGPDFSTLDGSASISSSTIANALLAGNNVTISTSVASGGVDSGARGDITISRATIDVDLPAPVGLSFNAASDINVSGSLIRSTGAPLDVWFSAAQGGSQGSVTLNQSQIVTAGGLISLGGTMRAVGPNLASPLTGAVGVGYPNGYDHGVGVFGSLLDAGSGGIFMWGQSVSNDTAASGVHLGDSGNLGTTLNARQIELYGWVDSNADIPRRGILVDGPNTLITATQRLSLQGSANSGIFYSAAPDGAPIGVALTSGSVLLAPPVADPDAVLTVQGTVNDAAPPAGGVGRRHGVYVGGTATLAAGGGATVSIDGTDQLRHPELSAAVSLGVGGALLDFQGAGPVTVQGNSTVELSGSIALPSGQTFTASAGDLLLVTGFLQGDASGLALNGRDITLAGTIYVGFSVPGNVTLNATRDIVVDSSTIQASDVPSSITLHAAAGGSGAGAIDLYQSYVGSLGGDIRIGGGSQAAGPTLTGPRAGAVGVTGPGVAVRGTTVDAGSGTLTIVGQSIATTGDAVGVLITAGGEGSPYLSGRDIDLYGWVDSNAAVTRVGVLVDPSGAIAATHAATITGLAHSAVYQDTGTLGPTGTVLYGQVAVAPQLSDPSASLTIVGRTQDAAAPTGRLPPNTRAGVWIESPATSLSASGGATVTIDGTDASPNAEYALRLAAGVADFSGAGAVTLHGNTVVSLERSILAPDGQPLQVGSDGTIQLVDLSLTGSPSALTLTAADRITASGSVSLSGAGQTSLRAPTLELGLGDPFTLGTGGPVAVFTDRLVTELSSAITSAAAGDAIVLAGHDQASNIAQVRDSGAPISLGASNGRWLLYGKEPDFAATSLNYDFRQFAAVYPAAPQGVGNGLLFDATATLLLQATSPITKVYDGTTAVPPLPASAFILSGFRAGDAASGPLATPSLAYSTANAAAATPLDIVSFTPPSISDSDARPVYGYTVQSDLRGAITARPVTVSGAVAADKTYDGNALTTLSGGTVNNLVAGQTLAIQYGSGQFSDPSAGTAKPVAANAALADGTGLAANYALVSSNVSAIADILPATLVYTADAAVTRVGQFPIPLSGQVSGFVAGETLASATTGSLLFSTLADATSPPGQYAVTGTGLSALNYGFVQAPGNATALTVLPAQVDPFVPTAAATALEAVREATLLPPPVIGSPAPRALDAVGATQPDAGGVGLVFPPIAVDALSWPTLSAVLGARDEYKRSVLSAGVSALEVTPGLADLPACRTVQQAEDGRCLVTDELVVAAETAAQTTTDMAAGTGTPAPSATVVPSAPAVSGAPVTPAAAPAAAPAAPPQPAAATPPAAVAPPASPAATGAPPTPPTPPTPAVPAAPGAATAAPVAAAPPAPPVVRPTAHPMLQPPPLPAARPVRSAALPQIARKLAVLVGIDNYVDASIPSLDNAGRDVDAVAAVLEKHLGYETVVVRDAGRRALVGVLNRLALTARPNDSVVVYYAGHGTVVESTGRGYWIPADADAARPQSWVANTDIEHLMGSIRARQVVLIADSCFSGSLVDLRRRVPVLPVSDPATLLGLRAAVVMSSGGNEPVADGGRNGHSPFAASLMQTLQGLDDWRPGRSVFQRVRDDVTRRMPQTPQYGPARQARHAEGADYLFEERELELARR